MAKTNSPLIPRKAAFHSLITAAIATLKQHNYTAYIRCLDNIGHFLELEYRRLQPADYHTQHNKALKLRKINWLEDHYTDTSFELDDALAYCAFEEAWVDDYLRKSVDVNGTMRYRRYLSPKSRLNRSTRKNINLGMRFLALSIKKQTLPINAPKDIVTRLDKEASSAIHSYRNQKQKFLDGTGTFIAVVMSLVCSFVTATAVAITIAAWPLAAVGVIAAVIFAATFTINWFSFRNVVSRMLNDAFGKDTLFEGWVHYNDPSTGKKQKLSTGRKVALGISTAVATLISIATGAVTYGFIVGLSKIALFSFLAAGTVGAACLPPLGVAIAFIFCISSLVLMMKPIINMVKTKDFKSLFSKPFEEANAIFSRKHKKNKGKSDLRLKIEKGITFTILGVLSGFTLFGLVALQVQNGAALARFLSALTAISSSIAIGIAYTFSAIFILIGQLPYALKSLSNAIVGVVSAIRNLFSSKRKDNKVIEDIKDTVSILSPNETVKLQAKVERQTVLECLDDNNNTSAPAPPPKQPEPARYYRQYLFAGNDRQQPLKETPIHPPISNSTHRF